MSADDLVKRVAAAYAKGHSKTAAFPPFSKNGPPPPPPGSSGPQKRNIPAEHAFDPRALKPMAKALWAASVSLGHALTAYRYLNRLKSATVSPDGMLGGRGYVMPVKEARQRLFDACEALSSIADTLYDEIQGPHWKSKLAQLEPEDAEDVTRFVNESQEILDNPEDEAEKDLKDIEEGKNGRGGEDDEPDGSKLPEGGSVEESEARPMMTDPSSKDHSTKEASLRGRTRIAATLDDASFWPREANSSLPVETLSGPRVDHLDRGEQTGPWGSYNTDEEPTNDWTWGKGEYNYPHEGDNDVRESASKLEGYSGLPSDPTPTEGWDFGIGYGAHGQGAGGYENPSDEGSGTKGVWGPHSDLPGTPPQSVGDTTPIVDVSLNERLALLSMLPGDTDEPVARSDYFDGPKGNLVHSEALQSESELPGEATPVDDNAPSMVDTYVVQEDMETPYVRYDYTTHTHRDDPLHPWPSVPREG